MGLTVMIGAIFNDTNQLPIPSWTVALVAMGRGIRQVSDNDMWSLGRGQPFYPSVHSHICILTV